MPAKPHRVSNPKLFVYKPEKDRLKDVDVFNEPPRPARKKPRVRKPNESLKPIREKFGGQFKAIEFSEGKTLMEVLDEALTEYFAKKESLTEEISRGYAKRLRKQSKRPK